MSNNWLLIAVEALCLASILLWFCKQKKKETPIKKSAPVHSAKCESQSSNNIQMVQMESKKFSATSPSSYKCSCRRLLTEFDLEFERNLLGNSDPAVCTCFKCRTKKQAIAIHKAEQRKKNIILHFFLYLFTFLWACFIQNLINRGVDATEAMIGVLVFLLIAVWFTIDFHIVKNFEIRDSESWVTGSHIEIESKGDGVYTAKKVDDWAGGGESLYNIPLFLTFPIWCIPHFLFLILFHHIRLYNKCPREVVDAYNKTKKEVQAAKISPSEQREYKSKKKEYYEKVNKTRERYSAYGEEYVQSKINEIPLPYLTKTIGTIIYYIIEIDPRQNMAFLLYNEGYGACDISGKIVQDNYFVCYDESKWQEIWQRELSYDVIAMLDEYIEYLRH